MQLTARSLKGRAFLLQFTQIMSEFGREIPWLEPLKTIAFSTNSTYFRDRFLCSLGCKEAEDVTPWQFVSSDESREYFGGILCFAHSPEKFRDRANQETLELLNHARYRFVSCLQVRDVLRGQGHGNELMKRALRAILARHEKVWGVASNFRLLPWYTSLGAKVHSPWVNRDNLWIVSWEKIDV